MQKFLGKKKEIWFMFGKKKSDLCTKRLDKMYQVNHDLKKLVHGEHMPIVLYLFDSLGHLTLIPTLIR